MDTLIDFVFINASRDWHVAALLTLLFAVGACAPDPEWPRAERTIEALMDLGWHMLAKGLGRVASEYRDVSRQLLAGGVIDEETSQRVSDMAGYRNRLVRFYDEVTPRELYAICTDRISEITGVTSALMAWVRAHPELVDRSL